MEGAAEKMCDTQPPSLSIGVTGGEQIEKMGVKLSSGRRDGWKEGVYLRFCFISHYLPLI